MKSKMFWGVGLASVISVGVFAQSQSQDQTRNPSTDRRVTVKGCLIPDASASATSKKSFTLSQADITKDEAVGKSSNAVKDAAKDTGAAASDAGKATADAVTMGHSGQKDKDVQLQVTTEPDVTIDLASQINHKVELVGIMSASDVATAKAKSGATATSMPLTLKAASVKSLSDKCD